jgi:hypothetical protein
MLFWRGDGPKMGLHSEKKTGDPDLSLLAKKMDRRMVEFVVTLSGCRIAPDAG